MEELHPLAGRITWYKQKQDKGLIIILLGFIICLTAVCFFEPGYLFFWFFFVPILSLNFLITGLKLYHFGIGEKGIVMKQMIGIKDSQFFAYSDLASAHIQQVASRGGPDFSLHLFDKVTKISKFRFQNASKAGLLQLEKALLFRDITVMQDITDAEEAGDLKALSFLVLIPIAILAGTIISSSIQHDNELETLRQNYQLGIATAMKASDIGHGKYRISYTYEANGNILSGNYEEGLMSGNEPDTNYYWDGPADNEGQYMRYPVQANGEKYVVLYSKNQPEISLILFDNPVLDDFNLNDVEVQEEWFDRY